MTALCETADAPIAPRALKRRLRHAERRRNLLFAALIGPLAFFVLASFIVPIASLLGKSIDNPEVHGNLPQTLALLEDWSGDALPDDATFASLAHELTQAAGTPAVANIAKRLNREQPGTRTLVMRTARGLPLPEGTPAREGLIQLDARWGETQTWHLLRNAGGAFTGFYLLSAVDRTVDADGNIVASPPEEAVYLDVLKRTFVMSIVVTAVCLLLGFPLAYLMATLPARHANLLMILVLLPFWTSVLVRVAAWIVLLQNEGLINQLLMWTGVTEAPVQMLFNRFGVYVAMVHILLPFMVLPLYSVMKGIPPAYLRAAVSLGCPPLRSFWRVYFPLTLPGIGAGALLVFILCMGYYITPALLGGPNDQMISYFIAFYTNQTVNWGMASALSVVLLAATLVLYGFYVRYLGTPNTDAR
ncbi:ABC transporter permease [Pseudothauera nasutitermitis]|uniref:ABC transporter permease n=1 Tax=Pseudothauera nasutitermitis TaxID=2565930 RepID=A0A4S4B7L5_9RHOO|nr:ABC transporter permease [Pseudothauera nasutitermitis]THF67003.1 ABC transporter permease [Pseudothauera nasutitermitis]